MSEVHEEKAVRPRGRSRMVLLGVIVAVAVGIGLFLGLRKRGSGLPRHDELAGLPALKADARDLQSTVVTPHLEEPIRPGGSVLWCATFQLVWNECCKAAQGDVHFQNDPAMVAPLNMKSASASDVNPESCLVMSGFATDGIAARIRQELYRKFGGQAVPDILSRAEEVLPPEGWLGYACLFVELPFAHRFKRFPHPLRFSDGTQVASFGIREVAADRDDMRVAGQVTVLDYRTDDDFVIALKPRDDRERIVLAKVTPGATLSETIAQVRQRVSEGGPHESILSFSESFVAPVLNFDLLREYDELYAGPIITPGPLNGMLVILALQSVRFRLDERGAILKSEAVGELAKCARHETTPRQFILDKPFLILLERRDAERPYLALWVGSSELLVPAVAR